MIFQDSDQAVLLFRRQFVIGQTGDGHVADVVPGVRDRTHTENAEKN
jgi:hypothetical protein